MREREIEREIERERKRKEKVTELPRGETRGIGFMHTQLVLRVFYRTSLARTVEYKANSFISSDMSDKSPTPGLFLYKYTDKESM
jgi:hypothetical protein